MPALTVYSYHWSTGEYIGEDKADVSPLEPGEFHIPAYATATKPPDVQPGQRAIYDKETDGWLVENVPVQPEPDPDMVTGDITIGELFDAQQ